MTALFICVLHICVLHLTRGDDTSDKYAILGVLKGEELHGYEISNRLKALEGFWYIFPGNLYRALNSLEKDGLVEVRRTEEHQGKMRKIYGVTDDGLKEFERWVSEPAGVPHTRHEAYLKIWFSSDNANNIMVQIKQIRDVSQGILNMMGAYDFSQLPEHIKWMMEAGKRHVRLDLEWADSCLEKLDSERGQADR